MNPDDITPIMIIVALFLLVAIGVISDNAWMTLIEAQDWN